MRKPPVEYWQGDVYLRDTTVPVKNLFDHLQKGRSIGSFLRRYPAVDHGQVVEVLSRAGELIIREETDLQPRTVAGDETDLTLTNPNGQSG